MTCRLIQQEGSDPQQRGARCGGDMGVVWRGVDD